MILHFEIGIVEVLLMCMTHKEDICTVSTPLYNTISCVLCVIIALYNTIYCVFIMCITMCITYKTREKKEDKTREDQTTTPPETTTQERKNFCVKCCEVF